MASKTNSIILPHNGQPASSTGGGDASPTGVSELSIYPSWTDAKEPPSWYARGADVDALFEVSDTLNWLEDSGDPTETYEPPTMETITSVTMDKDVKPSASVNSLSAVETSMDTIVTSLPSLFQNESVDNLLATAPSAVNLKVSESTANMLDSDLQVFDTPMEEQAFVSTILDTTTESTDNLPELGPL